MALCPWCKTDVGEMVAGKSCPKCKRIAVEVALGSVPPPRATPASSPPISSGTDLQLDLSPAPQAPLPRAPRARIPSFEGELQLSSPAPAPAPAPPIATPSVTAAPPVAPDRSSLDDDDDPLGEGPGADLSLDLDMGGGASLPPALSAPPPLSGRALPAAPVSNRSLAPADAPPPDAEAVDPYEARVLADYGEPPASFFLTPLYAWRVTRRKGELTRLLAAKKEEVTRAAKRAEDALVAFGERARPVAEQTGSRALDPLRAAEELMRGRDGALAGEMDAHRSELAKIDQQLAAIEHELSVAQADEKRIDEELAAAVEVKRRAEAKLKRTDIEIRNALQLLEGKKGAVS